IQVEQSVQRAQPVGMQRMDVEVDVHVEIAAVPSLVETAAVERRIDKDLMAAQIAQELPELRREDARGERRPRPAPRLDARQLVLVAEDVVARMRHLVDRGERRVEVSGELLVEEVVENDQRERIATLEFAPQRASPFEPTT